MTEIEDKNAFSHLSDDVILNILFKLVDDPRNWSRIACVSTKFSNLIRTVCWKNTCHQSIPSVVSDLLPANASLTLPFSPPGGWSALFKLAVCCPGLVHSGVLLENSDFGLERDLGPDELYQIGNFHSNLSNQQITSCSNAVVDHDTFNAVNSGNSVNAVNCSWSLYDDLYLDTVYSDVSNSQEQQVEACYEDTKMDDVVTVTKPCEISDSNGRKMYRSLTAHLASEIWKFSREQGNKLLASRFRGDCLYICDWPGCVHTEEKRNYMLFRGVFKNFKKSRVWRTINDGNKSKVGLNCAFCPSNDVWDLHSAFCLRPAYGFHDDGEPVVRAYVCENGHVSGAWTDWPLYT